MSGSPSSYRSSMPYILSEPTLAGVVNHGIGTRLRRRRRRAQPSSPRRRTRSRGYSPFSFPCPVPPFSYAFPHSYPVRVLVRTRTDVRARRGACRGLWEVRTVMGSRVRGNDVVATVRDGWTGWTRARVATPWVPACAGMTTFPPFPCPFLLLLSCSTFYSLRSALRGAKNPPLPKQRGACITTGL